MAVQSRLRSIAARCGRLFLAFGGVLALQAHAQQTYEVEEVTRSLLNTARVDEEGLQLHRWLIGMQADPPAGSEAEIRMMIRALALGTALTDSWIDALSSDDTSVADIARARQLMAQTTLAGASRCGPHEVRERAPDTPLQGIALKRFGDGRLPADAKVMDVQYRCITSYVSAPRALALATINLLTEGRRPAAGELISDLEAAMERDRRWPMASGGELQLLSVAGGRYWYEDGSATEMLTQLLLKVNAPRPVDAAARTAMSVAFTAQTSEQPAAPELVSQIMLWIPPVLRGSLRSDVEAYVAAASPQKIQCRPVQAHFIDEEGHLARLEVQCTVPSLDHLPVPVMGPLQDKAVLEQQYRQVLTGLRHAIGDAPEATLTGFTTLRWNADTQGWVLPPGAHAALHSRALLPTPVVDVWGAPSNISRFMPAALRVENIDLSALDEETRQKIKDMRLQMAEAMRNGL